MQRFFEDKKWLLLIAIVLAGSHARAQGTRDTLILNLDKALEIALSDNPTIKVAEEEIALKKTNVARSAGVDLGIKLLDGQSRIGAVDCNPEYKSLGHEDKQSGKWKAVQIC